jgi:excisionase family DNA binding protein
MEETAGSKGRTRDQRGPLLTAREAIDYLSISLSTLNRMERQGLLVPFRTPGGHRRYDRAMLDAYLETTRRDPRRQTPNDGPDGGHSGNGERPR